jgi:hypothetical protein
MLYHQTDAGPQQWNPLVNGVQITSGQLNVTVAKGATAVFHITRTGGTEAGIAVFVASDLALTSFLEGTLTYYVRNGAVLVDSVGVQPSTEFYLAAIPFDNFSTLAYALANVNTTGVTPKLSVFSDANVRVGTVNLPQLAPGQHMAEYLWQRFPGIQMTSGRLEIQSDLPIIGTALTQVNEQLSSLPMQPAVKAYTFTGSVGGVSYAGEMCFWLDGFYVQGYVRPLSIGGVPEQSPDTIPLTGSIVNGVFQTHTTGHPESEQLLTYVIINPFSLSQTTLQASFTVWLAATKASLGTGTLTLTATN